MYQLTASHGGSCLSSWRLMCDSYSNSRQHTAIQGSSYLWHSPWQDACQLMVTGRRWTALGRHKHVVTHGGGSRCMARPGGLWHHVAMQGRSRQVMAECPAARGRTPNDSLYTGDAAASAHIAARVSPWQLRPETAAALTREVGREARHCTLRQPMLRRIHQPMATRASSWQIRLRTTSTHGRSGLHRLMADQRRLMEHERPCLLAHGRRPRRLTAERGTSGQPMPPRGGGSWLSLARSKPTASHAGSA